ncbi:homoserine dehydrogenase [Saccharopolyspora mangrovi]|uniref:Homoserine dehydrogenase n=1 Tax=Saccharopolyspora mangrovi TaxID=3082379 RepID=A0ABU6A6X1_9PSEU|nr:homoserine dehydrogenase [Saccharopolyspora sp. S2-29]MEB3367139.1 homoserine dehydrogenase [Saccharopolyspora sp. S2-29]
MSPIPIVLAGCGPVGRAYAELVAERGLRHGLDLRVVAVRGRDRQREAGEWGPLTDLPELLERTGARVFAQAVPSDGDGRAAREALQALSSGAHVVTATKSHLLTHWDELEAAAGTAGRSVRISGATGAAMPAGDLARSVLRGFDVEEIAGCVNGTATFVLDRLADGADLAGAVAEAQRAGIAEADPGNDLSGGDAATKFRLLSALLWGWNPAETRAETEPITGLPDVPAGHRLRQVARAARDEPGVVRVALTAEPETSALGGLRGPEKAVRYDCGEAGQVTVSGGRSSPRGAALAMIKDTLGAVLEATTGFR